MYPPLVSGGAPSRGEPVPVQGTVAAGSGLASVRGTKKTYGVEAEFIESFAREMSRRSSSLGSSRQGSFKGSQAAGSARVIEEEGALVFAVSRAQSSRGSSKTGSLHSSRRTSPLPSPRRTTSFTEGPNGVLDPLPKASAAFVEKTDQPQRRPRVTLRPLPPVTQTVQQSAAIALAKPKPSYAAGGSGSISLDGTWGGFEPGKGKRDFDSPDDGVREGHVDGQRVEAWQQVEEQELSFTVGNISVGKDDADVKRTPEKTIEEICIECNERVEEALESGGDPVLCRMLLTATRRLVDLDDQSKVLTSRTLYNLGRLHRSLGEFSSAQMCLEVSLASGARPGVERPVVYFELCETCAMQCRWEDALTAVSHAITDIMTRLGLGSVHDISSETFKSGLKKVDRQRRGSLAEKGDFEGPSGLGRMLTLMLHRQGEIRQELGVECISSFERAMFVAKNLGTTHSDVASYTRDRYVRALQDELAVSTGGDVLITHSDENNMSSNRWSIVSSEKPRRLTPMMHLAKSSGRPAQQLKGAAGLSFPRQPRVSKVPESHFFIQLASSNALILQLAYRAHIARIVSSRRKAMAHGLKEILMAKCIQRIWRGLVSRRKQRELERLEEIANRKSAGLLLGVVCIKKLVYIKELCAVRDALLRSLRDGSLLEKCEMCVPQRPPVLAKAALDCKRKCASIVKSKVVSDGVDVYHSEALVLWKAYDSEGSTSIFMFFEGFGYSECDVDAFWDGCGASPGDSSLSQDNFLQGVDVMLKHVNCQFEAEVPAPSEVTEAEDEGPEESPRQSAMQWGDWGTTDEKTCLAQIWRLLHCRALLESARILQGSWRCRTSRQRVCEMVGMERGDVLKQIRIAKEEALIRSNALKKEIDARARISAYATTLQCAMRSHLSRVRIAVQKEHRERWMLQKMQWAIVRLQRSCAKRREMREFAAARRERMTLRLQCAWRQRTARQRVRHRRENIVARMIQVRMRLWYHFRWTFKSREIQPVQRAVRCFLSRRRLQHVRVDLKRREALVTDYYIFAAHLISAAWRGIMARKFTRERRIHVAQARACKVLNPFFVGHAARLLTRRLEIELKNSAKRKHEFATRLQMAWRCRVSINRACDQYRKREASFGILAHFKSIFARRQYRSMLSGDVFASSIQCAFRAHLARVEARDRNAGKVICKAAVMALCRARMLLVARDVLVHDIATEIGFDPDLVCMHCLEAFAVGGRCVVHTRPVVSRPARFGGATREENMRLKNAPFMQRLALLDRTRSLDQQERLDSLQRSRSLDQQHT